MRTFRLRAVGSVLAASLAGMNFVSRLPQRYPNAVRRVEDMAFLVLAVCCLPVGAVVLLFSKPRRDEGDPWNR